MKYDEWQDSTGMWYCGNIADVAHGSNDWWIPCRILGISPAAFAKMLVEDFNVSRIKYLTNGDNIGVLTYSWKKQSDERIFKNWLNKRIRERGL